MNVPNNNNVVIIRHGEFLTVYSNLDKVYVKLGDKVGTKQAIGTIYTNKAESKTELHFEVWQSKTLLNPEEWLAR
jgi:murein hydrolase activator